MVTQLFWSLFRFWAELSDFHSTPAQLCLQTLLLIVSPVYMLLRLEFDHAGPSLNGEKSDWGFELTSVAHLTLQSLWVCCLCLSLSLSHSLAPSWRQCWGDGRFVRVSRPQCTQRQGVGILALSPAHTEACTKAGQTWSVVRILTPYFFPLFSNHSVLCFFLVVLFF